MFKMEPQVMKHLKIKSHLLKKSYLRNGEC